MTLRGSNSYVVRDVTDIFKPKTVGNLGVISIPKFAGPTEVIYADGSELVRVPLSGYPKTRVAANPGLINYAFSWGPFGDVVYLAQAESGLAAHLVMDGKDTVFAAALPPIPVVGCESQFCSGTDSWDLTLEHSSSELISFVDHVAGASTFRIWERNGRARDVSDGQGRFMTAWSGDGLYFRDGNGVEVWRDGVVSPFLPGVAWIRPKASPAGGKIVFSTVDAQGWHHVSIVDTSTRQVHEIKKARSGPAFLTSRYLWYRGERACVASDHCPAGWHVVDSGKPYIYDLETGTEYESIITQVLDVWPHAA